MGPKSSILDQFRLLSYGFSGSPTLRKPTILWVSIIYVYNIYNIILYIYTLWLFNIAMENHHF